MRFLINTSRRQLAQLHGRSMIRRNLGFLSSVKDKIRKEVEKNEDMKKALEKFDQSNLKYQQYKSRILGDYNVKNFKEGLSETFQELIGNKPRRNINNPIMKPPVSPKEEKSSDAKQSSANVDDEDDKANEVPTSTSSALVVTKEQASAWDKIGERLRETPIIQSILDAAKQAKATRAGQTIGRGARAAKDKIGDATEDAREFWETSQNPWIYRLSSLYDGLFGETETAVAIRELRRADPSFTLEEWKEDVKETVLGDVLDAFLRGESLRLKKWLGEAAFNTVNHAIRDRKAEGLVVDPNVLDIRDVEILAAKAEDKHSPIIVLQFMAQQINCVKNREGEIVEGAEDEIRAVYYALAFQRDYCDETSSFNWKIIEMSMLGALPYV